MCNLSRLQMMIIIIVMANVIFVEELLKLCLYCFNNLIGVICWGFNGPEMYEDFGKTTGQPY